MAWPNLEHDYRYRCRILKGHNKKVAASGSRHLSPIRALPGPWMPSRTRRETGKERPLSVKGPVNRCWAELWNQGRGMRKHSVAGFQNDLPPPWTYEKSYLFHGAPAARGQGAKRSSHHVRIPGWSWNTFGCHPREPTNDRAPR